MKRGLLAACVFASAAVMACSSSGGAPSQPSRTVEIFSWWTNPGEAEALRALLQVVHDDSPLDVTNSAADLHYSSNIKQVLTDRLLRGEPPDTFQVHGGAELITTWVSIGGDDSQNRMEPIDFLYDAQGWRSQFPVKLIDMLSYKGHVYSVPVNIHRGNVLYYNTAIFQQVGQKPPTTWDEFFVVADAIKKAGKVPLALGGKDAFGLGMIFDSGLVAKGGADYYVDFFKGKKDPSMDKELRDTVQLLVKVMDYVQADPDNKGWDGAAEMLHTGDAAMTIMGDWCKGYLQETMTAGVDFGSVPVPDTAGSFVVITDTFGLPKGAPHRDNAIALLKMLGTVEAEDAFNPIKGSIPARIDVDKSKYDQIANQTMADYAAAAASTDPKKGLVPSLAHGSAAPQAFLNNLNDALAAFLKAPDGNKLIQAIVNIYPRLNSN